MNITLNLSKAQSRRLTTLAKSSQSLTMVMSRACVTFFDASGEMFKAVVFDGVSTATSAYLLSKNLINATCVSDGILSITIEDSLVNFEFTDKSKSVVLSATGAISPIPYNRVSDIVDLIIANTPNTQNLSRLFNNNNLIDICTATENNLIISKDIITTSSNNIKIFTTCPDVVIDEDIGITLQGMKEMNRFKIATDTVIHSIKNYIVLSKPGYVLGIRKAYIKSQEFIPETYLTNEKAKATLWASLNNLMPLLNSVNFDPATTCKWDLVNNFIHIDTGKEQYKIKVNARVLNSTEPALKSLEFNLDNLKHFKNVLTIETDQKFVTIYKNIVKFSVDNLNILIRCTAR